MTADRCTEWTLGIVSLRRVVVFAMTVGLAAAATAAEEAVPAAWSPDLMMQVKRVGSVQVSPDGNRVVLTVRQAVMDGDLSEYRTHISLANMNGSKSRQLTQG